MLRKCFSRLFPRLTVTVSVEDVLFDISASETECAKDRNETQS